MFKVAKLKGVPGGVWWPVRLTEEESKKKGKKRKTGQKSGEKKKIFVNSDNALLDVDSSHLRDFNLSYRTEGERILKKKKKLETLDAFLEDFEWAINYDEAPNDSIESKVKLPEADIELPHDGTESPIRILHEGTEIEERSQMENYHDSTEIEDEAPNDSIESKVKLPEADIELPHDGTESPIRILHEGTEIEERSQMENYHDSTEIEDEAPNDSIESKVKLPEADIELPHDGTESPIRILHEGTEIEERSQMENYHDSTEIEDEAPNDSIESKVKLPEADIELPHDGTESPIRILHEGTEIEERSQMENYHDSTEIEDEAPIDSIKSNVKLPEAEIELPHDGTESPIGILHEGTEIEERSQFQLTKDGTNINSQFKTCNIISHENKKIVIIPGSESEETTVLVTDNIDWTTLDHSLFQDNFDTNELFNETEGQTDLNYLCDEKNMVYSDYKYTAVPLSEYEGYILTKKNIVSETDETIEKGCSDKCQKKRKYMAITSDSDSVDMEHQDPPLQIDEIDEIVPGSSSSEMSTEYPILKEMLNKLPKHKKKKMTIKPTFKDSDESEDETQLSWIARDTKYNGIYFSLVHKSEFSKLSGEIKKTKRVYDSKHPCPFCGKIVSNFSHHIFAKKHELEDSVKMIKIEEDEKERKKRIDLLRLKAANEHNIKVKEEKKGEIFLLRRTSVEDVSVDAEGKRTIDLDKYGPCPHCYGWVLLKSIRRHYMSCAAITKPPVHAPSKGELIIQSDILAGRISENASQMLKEEVFPIMQVDEITQVAKTDNLIIVLGNNWMMRNRGNRIMRKYYTSSVMRLSARLKIQCQQLTEQDSDLDGFLKPCFFETVVQASLNCCHVSEIDAEDLKAPSNCIKLGYDIKRMLASKLAAGIKNQEKEKMEEAQQFLDLMRLEWSLRVTRLARTILTEQSFNKEKKLPLPSDIKKLSKFLLSQIATFKLEIMTYNNYRKVVTYVLARLTLYNRRRCHEVQAMRLDSYASRKTGIDEVAIELRGELTKFEAKLLETQEMVIIRGKTGKGVPVIIPEDVKEALAFIVSSHTRQQVGVLTDNPYVFANNRAGVFRAYDAIKTVTSDPAADLQLPELVRTSNLRKYMATMLQALNTTENERQWIVDHLGHTLNVHKIHYRQTSDVLERVDVSKILLIQDFGLCGKYKGKTIQDIDLNDIMHNAVYEQDDETPSTKPKDAVDVDDVVDEEYIPVQNPSDSEDEGSDEEAGSKPIKLKIKLKQVTSTRQKWTEQEEEELKLLFEKNFENKKCPGLKDLRKAVKHSKTNSGVIWKRPQENIKKKVSAMLIKQYGRNYSKCKK